MVVNNVPTKELLFAIARDANVEIDIHEGVIGQVTLNAIDVTFEQILDRISRQAPIRYSKVNDVVRIEPDTPFLKHYEVSYVNIARTSESAIAIATEVSSTGAGSEGSSNIGNLSSTEIQNSSTHQFWNTLVGNLERILQQTEPPEVADHQSTEAADAGDIASIDETDEAGRIASNNPNIIVSPESSMLSIFATQEQHHKIREYLDLALSGAQRQVFIEATIVEVELNDDYQAGVDWSNLVNAGEKGFSFNQTLTGTNLATAPVSTLTFSNPGNRYDLSATVKLLNQFGNAKVLSTPKILALNNQTALLKVVDNRVYFTINVETDTEDGLVTRTFESIIHTLPVGLVMSVTPQTSGDGLITLNVRPTISRILRFVPDPNPALGDTESLVPEVSVREIETILRVNNGDVAVIGGLMQDNRSNSTDGVPRVSKLPYVGDLFSYKENKASKSELVIFLKPIVVDKPSLKGEFAQYKRFLEPTGSGTKADSVN
ncbi:MAG: pilus (MSHA type) biogenesis protein MshL [Pseudomonadales bacterium]